MFWFCGEYLEINNVTTFFKFGIICWVYPTDKLSNGDAAQMLTVCSIQSIFIQIN